VSSNRTDDQGRAFKKSQLQIQIYVNKRSGELNHAIRVALPTLDAVASGIHWVSPLESEKFVEYRDESFLRRVNFPALVPALAEFWPRQGAHWDGLATVDLKAGGQGVLLVEAKCYVAEMKSSMMARAPESIERIRMAFEEAKSWCGADPGADWTAPYYQTANRLAHLCFFARRSIPAWLVNVCMENDPHAPTTRLEWESGISEALRHLGLKQFPSGLVGHVYLPSRPRSELLAT